MEARGSFIAVDCPGLGNSGIPGGAVGSMGGVKGKAGGCQAGIRQFMVGLSEAWIVGDL